MNVEAWIFDAYVEPEGVRVWVLDAEGRALSFLDEWRPGFCFAGPPEAMRRAAEFLRRRPYPVSCRRLERTELFSGETKAVLEARVPARFHGGLVRRVRDLGLFLYNADVHPIQVWHYERGHFPLARCEFELDGERLKAWTLRDDPWEPDYALPPFRSAHLALTGSDIAGRVDSNHALRGLLSLSFAGQSCEFEGPVEEQLDALSARLREWDPDILTSDWGDGVLLPLLARAANRCGRELPLSRDPGRGLSGRGGRSFYTYGRTVYQTGVSYLFGRWHLDLKNSFTLRECGLDGLLETARIARIPVQRAARCTIGTALTSMQLECAWRDGVLVPMDKEQAEDFRPASALVVADKGGLVYEPDVGWHEEVAEYDFVSMYPELMERWNISPETVNCACCPDNRVPEIGHHLCRRRRGLVPKVVAPLLKKRMRYKALAKLPGPGRESYRRRAAAHKWTLVTIFGYLGFKNARFGKIEAHECVTAAGREVLLRAKEAVERRGFRLLHALVDCVWVQGRPGADYEGLRRAIEEEAGCPVGLEGVYRWLRFCPSKLDPESGVPSRYFGAYSNGELKVRGLALRRRDTPELVARMQRELLERLAAEDGLSGCRRALDELRGIVAKYRARLREGEATAQELAVAFQLSKDPLEYRRDTLHALAAKSLARGGLRLKPGETVRYVIASARDAVADWRTAPLALLEGPLEYDCAKYEELLERAAEEALGGLEGV